VEECRTDHLVLIVPPGHELANEKNVSIQKIIEYPFICREEGSGTREVMIESMQAAGINPSDMRIAMELGSLEAIKGAVETGMGVSILSKATLIKELKLGTLVAVDTDPPINRPFSFVHQKQKFKARAMDELLNFARTYCESHQEI
jgi:DNA-binding transcriptional LysR family regulator